MRLDAVLTALPADFERTRRLLLPTLAANCRAVGRIWVVVPDGSAGRARAELVDRAYPFDLSIVPETKLVPERLIWGRARRGWYVQQLIKFAIADRVDTPYYLTLDCDVLAVRRCTVDDLLPGGRALLDVGPPGGAQPEWYTRAAELLGLPEAPFSVGVTPILYSTDVIRDLSRHIDSRAGLVSRGATMVLGRRRTAVWRFELARRIPWTEMGLYATFLHGRNLVSRYHAVNAAASLNGNNFWTDAEFDRWDPARSFDGDRVFYFSVAQSRSNVTTNQILERIRPWFDVRA